MATNLKAVKVALGFILYVTNELHFDFTQKTLTSISTKNSNIEVILFPNKIKSEDVKRLSIPLPCKYLNSPSSPVSVAAAWNSIAKEAFNSSVDYLLIANTDIVFHKHCIDNLVQFAIEHPEFVLWSASEWPNLKTLKNATISNDFDENPHFSCFLINKNTIDKIGYFDENYQAAYMEDIDYHLRILIAGEKASKTSSALFYHFGSRTIACDSELNRRNSITHHQNRQYFIAKWGVDGFGKGGHQIYSEYKNKAKKEV